MRQTKHHFKIKGVHGTIVILKPKTSNRFLKNKRWFNQLANKLK